MSIIFTTCLVAKCRYTGMSVYNRNKFMMFTL